MSLKNKLKNPVWYSLSETHKKWCLEINGVKFYDPAICPFGAFTDVSKTADALTEYSKLTDKFFLVSEAIEPNWNENFVLLDRKIEGCQMVLDKLINTEISEEIVLLTTEHIDEIYDLVWLVMPGYYRRHTFEMGNYFGIFKDGKLVSIAGQRMQTDDFIEVSAVATHPDYTRRGYAKQLTAFVTQEILSSGKQAILHTTKGNPAIRIYEKLGFRLTRDMNWWYFYKK